MENLEKQHTEITVAIKREIAANEAKIERFHLNDQMDAVEFLGDSKKDVRVPIPSIVNKEQSSNVISDGRDIENIDNFFESHAAIKMKNVFDLADFSNEAEAVTNNNLSCNNVPENLIRIKEEVYDTSFENIPYLMNEKVPLQTNISRSEIPKNRRKSRQQPKCDIEKVFVDEQQYSILSTEFDINDEIFEDDERIDGFQIIKFEDNDNFSGTTLNHNQSEQFLRPTSSSSRTFNSNVGEIDKKTQKQIKDKFRMCEICGKIYTSSALKKHLKFTHSNSRPFPCALCDRAFKDSTGLKVG